MLLRVALCFVPLSLFLANPTLAQDRAILEERENVNAPVTVRELTLRTVDQTEIPVLLTTGRGADSYTQQAQRLRHKNRFATETPEPISQYVYRSLTGGKVPPDPPPSGPGQDIAAPDARLEYLRLSPRKPWSGWGHVEFNEPRHVSAEGDYVVFYTATDPFMAYVRANVEVKKGAKYLVDVTVSVQDENTITLGAGSNSQKFTLAQGQHHLLVYLVPDMTGMVGMLMWPDIPEYTFHSLEVTLVE